MAEECKGEWCILYYTIFSPRNDKIASACWRIDPNDALDGLLMGRSLLRGRYFAEERVRVRFVEVKDADFLLLVAGNDPGTVWGDVDGSDDMVVGERVQYFSRVRVPYFAASRAT